MKGTIFKYMFSSSQADLVLVTKGQPEYCNTCYKLNHFYKVSKSFYTCTNTDILISYLFTLVVHVTEHRILKSYSISIIEMISHSCLLRHTQACCDIGIKYTWKH